MSRPTSATRLLRWYPTGWRERYGNELVALLEDTYGERAIPWPARLNTARAGLTEHVRTSGLGRQGEGPAERARNGSLLVLCAWTFFVVGGASFAKFNEHWQRGHTPGFHWLPDVGYVTVEVAAVVGLLLVLTAGLIALPALLDACRRSGWALLRRHVLRAVSAALATVAAGVPLVLWAHHLDSHQRNGGLTSYSVAFVGVGILAVATLVTVTASAVSLTTRLALSASSMRWLARLALAMVAVMATVVLGTALWWGSLADMAPSLLGGRVPLDLVLTGGLMVVGFALAVVGARRITRALPELPTGPSAQLPAS